MWSSYRLAYLGVAALVSGGVVFVAAEAEHGQTRGIRFGTVISQQVKTAQADAAVDDGTEKGNLSEVGAKELAREGDFLTALVSSREQPVLLFKHSTECNVSGAAYRRTAAWLRELGGEAPPVFLVKVIEHRTISQFIAKQTQIKHESPQAIFLSGGRPVWNTDHENITADSLGKAFDSLRKGIADDDHTD